MTRFAFAIDPSPRGFTVSATADRAPVTVTLREWAWSVTSETPWPARNEVALVRTRELVDVIADQMCRTLYDNLASRAANVRVKHGTVPRTARSIYRRVAAEVKRLHDQVPAEVLATQRAVFAATFGTGNADWPELYEPQYAMLRRDIRAYRAAAIALHGGEALLRRSVEMAFRHSPEYAAAKVAAEAAGLKLSAERPYRSDGDSDVRHEVLDRLAGDWRGLFSPTGKPYRSLNRTLMNLPGGIPAGGLGRLSDLELPRPLTDRVELLAVLGWYEHAVRHVPARQHQDLILHASRAAIIKAMAAVSAATHAPASPRRAADIAHAVAYMCDYPEQHTGTIAGLARKAIAWHREMAGREAAETIERLGGDKPAALPPLPLPVMPGITFLATVASIAEEAALMGNCIASYAERAVEGSCYLFHADHGGEMATIEVSWDGTVAQAEGPRNRPNSAARWARAALARWGRGFPATAMPPAAPGDPWAVPEDHQLAAAGMPF